VMEIHEDAPHGRPVIRQGLQRGQERIQPRLV
jgi:hypothetical protein